MLGYINNTTKNFSKYVERRISVILDHSSPPDWGYVPTSENPADVASRPRRKVKQLLISNWLTGPTFLYENFNRLNNREDKVQDFELPEQRKDVTVLKLDSSETNPSPMRLLCNRLSSWTKLIKVVKIILKLIHMTNAYRQKNGVSLAPRSTEILYEEAVKYVIASAQSEDYKTPLQLLKSHQSIPDSFKISELSPFLLDDLIVVGGRLRNTNLPFHVKHPILIPRCHPISTSICRHYHGQAKHQGSHFSHGYIIQSGFHIENGRQLLRKIISDCALCKKLRQRPCEQMMADLPTDRLAETKPFENVGADVFGPFHIHDGLNTRRTNATKKIWVVIFVCLPSRAVHLKPLFGMDTSSFRNALARFISMRGPVKIIRSDQGTNFVSSKRQLEIDLNSVSQDLETKNIKWLMNASHSSHHRGTWKRKIGSVRRVLEASFALASKNSFSRDEFLTFIAEAAAVVNHTPLWETSASPSEPNALTPAMLLTLRQSSDMGLETFNSQDLLAYGTRRYRRVQYLSEQFWQRWRNEYLQTLTRRHKWKHKQPCIIVGDVVLLKEKQSPRNQWPMGKVQSVKFSDDGLTLSVSVSLLKTGNTFDRRTFWRPISDMILLIPSKEHGCEHPV